jgi:hypothetical protein
VLHWLEKIFGLSYSWDAHTMVLGLTVIPFTLVFGVLPAAVLLKLKDKLVARAAGKKAVTVFMLLFLMLPIAFLARSEWLYINDGVEVVARVNYSELSGGGRQVSVHYQFQAMADGKARTIQGSAMSHHPLRYFPPGTPIRISYLKTDPDDSRPSRSGVLQLLLFGLCALLEITILSKIVACFKNSSV